MRHAMQLSGLRLRSGRDQALSVPSLCACSAYDDFSLIAARAAKKIASFFDISVADTLAVSMWRLPHGDCVA